MTEFSRSIEILMMKAAVDREFCERLLIERGEVDQSINFELDPSEKILLASADARTLSLTIDKIVVPDEYVEALRAGDLNALKEDENLKMIVVRQEIGFECTLGIQPDMPKKSRFSFLRKKKRG